jgi:hypothetical protein
MGRTHPFLSVDHRVAPTSGCLEVLAAIFRKMSETLDAHADDDPGNLRIHVAVAALDAITESLVEDADKVGGTAGIAWMLDEVRHALEMIGAATDAT